MFFFPLNVYTGNHVESGAKRVGKSKVDTCLEIQGILHKNNGKVKRILHNLNFFCDLIFRQLFIFKNSVIFYI